MARIKTGVSKKANRLNLEALDMFYAWRATGIVDGVNDTLTADQAMTLAGITIKTTTIKAIDLAIRKVTTR